MTVEPIPFPNYIDAPQRFLFWTFGQMLPFMFITFIGILLHSMFTFAIIGIVVSWSLSRFKDTKPDGFLLHLGYWYGIPYQAKARTLINVFIRTIYPA